MTALAAIVDNSAVPCEAPICCDALTVTDARRGKRDLLATAASHYEPGSISLEITGMIAEHDQVVLQWTNLFVAGASGVIGVRLLPCWPRPGTRSPE